MYIYAGIKDEKPVTGMNDCLATRPKQPRPVDARYWHFKVFEQKQEIDNIYPGHVWAATRPLAFTVAANVERGVNDDTTTVVL
jgi:hypothetical protein